MSKGYYSDFVDSLGQRESGNDYGCENKFGFLGRWQFGKPRLYDLGISIDGYAPKGMIPKLLVSKSQFLKDKDLQDRLMLKHVMSLRDSLGQKYAKYLGKEIQGIRITLSGMIAATHLKGEGVKDKDAPNSKQGLRHFLLYDKNPTDGLGTPISEYINKFGDYELNIDFKQALTEIEAREF